MYTNFLKLGNNSSSIKSIVFLPITLFSSILNIFRIIGKACISGIDIILV